MNTKLLTFNEAIQKSKNHKKRHLLLGNGFSIAYKYDIFTYKSLLDESDFSELPEVRKVFDLLDTVDFEAIIKSLQECSKIISAYGIDKALQDKISEHSEKLKSTLVNTLAGKHPEGPFDISESQYQNARKFLSYFVGENEKGNIYTLNYDLLLYWVLMHEEETFVATQKIELSKDDGFGKEKGNEEASYVIWKGESNAHGQRVHYLHGALHLFDAGKELKKFTWTNTGRRLIEQTREAMNEEMYPLFVAEGTSEQKLTKIKHSGFLYHSFKSFSKTMEIETNCLFIFGHSLAENDMHILNKISEGKISEVYISIYGDIESELNKSIVHTANLLIEQRRQSNGKKPLNVIYYDASSANIW